MEHVSRYHYKCVDDFAEVDGAFTTLTESKSSNRHPAEQAHSTGQPDQAFLFRPFASDQDDRFNTSDLRIQVDVGTADLRARAEISSEGCLVCMERDCDAILVECGHRC
jgi:hypothetical protein